MRRQDLRRRGDAIATTSCVLARHAAEWQQRAGGDEVIDGDLLNEGDDCRGVGEGVNTTAREVPWRIGLHGGCEQPEHVEIELIVRPSTQQEDEAERCAEAHAQGLQLCIAAERGQQHEAAYPQKLVEELEETVEAISASVCRVQLAVAAVEIGERLTYAPFTTRCAETR